MYIHRCTLCTFKQSDFLDESWSFCNFLTSEKHEFVKQGLFMVSRFYWLSLLMKVSMNSHNKDWKTPHLDTASKLAVYVGLSPIPSNSQHLKGKGITYNTFVMVRKWSLILGRGTIQCTLALLKITWQWLRNQDRTGTRTHFGKPEILTLVKLHPWRKLIYETRNEDSYGNFGKLCICFLFFQRSDKF